MDDNVPHNITCMNQFSSVSSQGSSLSLEFELDDDPPGFGLLTIDARGDHFAGKISIWCMKEELLRLAEALSHMPLKADTPAEFFTDDVTLNFLETGSKRLVRCDVKMRISSEENELGYVPSMSTSHTVDYSQLKRFSDDLSRLANGEIVQAIL